MDRCGKPAGAHFGGFALGIVVGAPAGRRLMVGPQSHALVLATGRFAEKSDVHLPLGEPHDLALFHRRCGACLGRQRLVFWSGPDPNLVVRRFVCSLRLACAVALSNGTRKHAHRDN